MLWFIHGALTHPPYCVLVTCLALQYEESNPSQSRKNFFFYWLRITCCPPRKPRKDVVNSLVTFVLSVYSRPHWILPCTLIISWVFSPSPTLQLSVTLFYWVNLWNPSLWKVSHGLCKEFWCSHAKYLCSLYCA